MTKDEQYYAKSIKSISYIKSCRLIHLFAAFTETGYVPEAFVVINYNLL